MRPAGRSRRTLSGKVAYVRESMGDDPARNFAPAVATGVWRCFYQGIRFSPLEDGRVAGIVLDLVELPSVREVRAVMRRLDRPKPAVPADPPTPYYATRD